ncbi:hypothetical protein Tco_0883001 [Tanacetum coccineum]
MVRVLVKGPVWNNVQRLNHQNKFAPKAVLTKTGIFPVNAARQNPSSQAAETSTARKVNTARPIVNKIRQRNNFYKSHSPIRRPFNKSTAPKANFTNHKVNTARDKTVSVVRGYRETVVKASAGCNWRPKRHYWNKVSKYNSGSKFSKHVNFKDPLGRPNFKECEKVIYEEKVGTEGAFHGIDYMDIEEAVTKGRQSKETEQQNVTHDTEVLEKRGSNEEPVNGISNIGVSTAFNISTASRPEFCRISLHKRTPNSPEVVKLRRSMCTVFSAIREFVDIVKKTLEFGARGVE